MLKIFKKYYVAIFALSLLLPFTASAAPVLWVGDSSGKLGTVDVATGTVNVVGNMGAVMTDIAFDASGNLWGIDFGNLYSIDKATAASTYIGKLGTSLNSLVFGAGGTLYAANNSLYTINTTTGTATNLGSGGDSYSSSGDLAFIGGELFLSSTFGGDSLVKLDTATGAGTTIGVINALFVYGLASPDGNNLYGLAGTSIYSVNSTTGAGTFIRDYSGNGLGSAYGSAFLSEATPAVPVPAALLMFAPALLGFFGLRRRAKDIVA